MMNRKILLDMSWLAISVVLLTCYVAFLARSIGGSYLALPAYMDEIFHIPQAQVICRHDFTTWDNKITTFPGLYYLSFLLQQGINVTLTFFGKSEMHCDEWFLRMVNVMLSVAIFFAAYTLRKQVLQRQHTTESTKVFPDAIYLSWLTFLYPLSFLYYQLYYTDTASLLFFLLTHCYVNKLYFQTATKDKKNTSLSMLQHGLQLLLASSCIFMRQTNVLWILFLLGIAMLQLVEESGAFRDDDKSWSVGVLFRFIVALWEQKFHLLAQTWSLLVPIVGFAVFVVHNKGIVLGDKENHQPAVHFVMLPHALVLYTLMVSPRMLLDVLQAISREQQETKSYFAASWKVLKRNVCASWWQVVFCVVVLVAAALALVFGSLSHPFLLADNRHYTFYLWNRVLKYFRYRLLLAPFYAVLVLIAVLDLSRSKGMVWLLIFFLAMALSLWPTPLLEPRYFTQAVVTALLHGGVQQVSTQHSDPWRHVMYVAHIVVLVAFNAAVLYVYFHKSFTWHDGTVARFLY